MMLSAKLIYLKDKQAFRKDDGQLRLIGKPIETAKKLAEEGCGLLHIIDLDGQKGLRTNFDVYDKLTYLMHVQAETGENFELVEKLLAINVRVVIPLPAKTDLKKFSAHRRLLVGKIANDYPGNVEDVYDLLIENATLESVKKFSKSGKRVIVFKKDFEKTMEKLVFAVID